MDVSHPYPPTNPLETNGPDPSRHLSPSPSTLRGLHGGLWAPPPLPETWEAEAHKPRSMRSPAEEGLAERSSAGEDSPSPAHPVCRGRCSHLQSPVTSYQRDHRGEMQALQETNSSDVCAHVHLLEAQRTTEDWTKLNSGSQDKRQHRLIKHISELPY